MTRSVEIVVVGGGSTGWAVAGALAKRGREVLVLDRRETSMAGARWLDGVPAWCFDEAEIARPEPPERWGGEQGDAFLSVAGTDARVHVEKPEAIHVDMRHLVGRLRARALAAGVRHERAVVARVTARAQRAHALELEGGARVHARLFIDASGISAAVRKRAPVLRECCPEVAPEDTCAAAQFQYRVSDPAALRAFLRSHGASPGDSVAFLATAGGYSTLTLFTEPELREVGLLTGTIPALGAPTGAEVLRRFAARASWLGPRLFGGQGAIPLRRPYATLGAAGVALVGDAACQVYSSHGSGVGMGLVAAQKLARAVGGAGDPGAPEALDAYTRSFHRSHGGLLAGADAFRRLSQRLERSTVAALIEAGVLDSRIFASGIAQRMPAPDAVWLIERAARALGQLRPTLKVAPTVACMVVLSALSGLAPRPRGLRARGFEALVARLVGPTPSGGAPVEHVEIDAHAL